MYLVLSSLFTPWFKGISSVTAYVLRLIELLQEHSRYGSVPVVFPGDDDPLTSRDAIINIGEVASSDTIILAEESENATDDEEDEDEVDDEQDDNPIASSDSVSDISEAEDETDDDDEEDEMEDVEEDETDDDEEEDEMNDEDDDNPLASSDISI